MNKKGDNRSYFSVGRGRRKKNFVIIIPIVAAVVITFVVLSSMSGPLTNKMVLHNHVNVNVTYNGQAITVPEHIGIVQIGKADDPLLYGTIPWTNTEWKECHHCIHMIIAELSM